MVLVEPAARSDIRPVASGLHADAVCGCPPALAATARGIYGGLAVGTDDRRHDTGYRAHFTPALGPRAAFWVMALLCAAALPIAFAMRRGSRSMHPGRIPSQQAPLGNALAHSGRLESALSGHCVRGDERRSRKAATRVNEIAAAASRCSPTFWPLSLFLPREPAVADHVYG